MHIYMKDDEVTIVGGDDPTDGYEDPLDCLVKESKDDSVHMATEPGTVGNGDGSV